VAAVHVVEIANEEGGFVSPRAGPEFHDTPAAIGVAVIGTKIEEIVPLLLPTGPQIGKLRLGETVQLAYVDQSRDALADRKTVWEEISDSQDIIRVGKYEIQSRGYVSRFNFKGADQQKFVGQLSGGERNRVHLAKLLRRGANVLLLDEPTNDLDVETLRALEEALLNFPGTVLVISHDRWFLDRIATHMLAFEGDSHVEWFAGNFSDYEVDHRKRLAAAGTDSAPTRIRYKPLVR
jgi:ATPase subunit of ABC transporter with duplicated ATPase domains